MNEVNDTDNVELDDSVAKRRYEELEAIYRTAPVGLGLVDHDLRYLRVNDRLATFLGKPREEIIGRTLREVAPDGATKVEPVYRQIIETSEPVLDLEVSATTAARPNVERHWLVSYSPVFSADGRVVAISSIIQDVTERTEAVKALRASEERFRAFMDHSPTHFYMKDAELRHIYSNRALLETLGVSLDEFEGTETRDFFPPEVTKLVEKGDRKVLEGSSRVEVTDLHTEIDGEHRWWHEVKFPVIDASGELIIGGVASEITTLKMAKADLEERADFEELLSKLAAAFVNLPIDDIDETLTDALERVGQLLRLDRCAYGHLTPDGTEVIVTHVWNSLQEEPTGQQYRLADHEWLGSPFKTAKPVIWSRSESTPKAAPSELATLEEF